MRNVIELRFEVNGNSYFSSSFENSSIQISKKVADLNSLSSQSEITEQTFRVPLEDGLLDLLGDVTNPTIDANINLNKKINGSILVNGFIFSKGSFQFISAYKTRKGGKEVEFLFKGNQINLKQELEDITMASLLEGETIPYNAAEISTFLDAPQTYRFLNGYYFPLVDYGQKFTADTSATTGTIIGNGETALTQTDFKPAVTFQKCFEKIADKTGINISWDTSINDLVQRQCILLHNNERKMCELDTSPRDYTGYIYRTTNNNQAIDSGTSQFIVFNAEYNYNQDQFNLGANTYTFPVTGNYVIRLYGQIVCSRASGATLDGFAVNITANATSGNFKIYENVKIVNIGQTTYDLFIDITFRFRFEAGQTLNFTIGQTSGLGTVLNCLIGAGFRFEVVESPNVETNSNILVPANCPDLTAWDLYRTIILQCNGITEIEEDRTYNIIPWEEWIDSNDDVIFLDDKIDDTKDTRIRPYSIEGAKTIEFNYSESEDLYSSAFKRVQKNNYGDQVILDTGTDGTNKKISFKLPFASPPLSTIPNTSMPIIKLYDEDSNTVNDKPILIQTYNTTNSIDPHVPISFDLDDAISTYTKENRAYLPYVGHWEMIDGEIGGYNTNDYNFGQSLTFFRSEGYPNNTLYNRFWKRYIDETYSEKSRQLKISLKLPKHIVTGLKFNEKVFYKGSKFRIVEISNYNLITNDPVSVTLMKRVNIENVDIAPFYPTDVIDGIVQWANSSDDTALSPPDGSSADQSDLEESAIAYGFFYDSNLDICVQRGYILQI